jgi:hypothetical protein
VARCCRAILAKLAAPRCAPLFHFNIGSFLMNDNPPSRTGIRAGISIYAMELGVALLLLAIGIVVVYDSYRLGSRWGADGPQSGYFPFYIGVLICVASLATLAHTLITRSGRHELFVTWVRFKLVLTVLIPAAVYVLCVQYVGLYVASAAYITVFMVWLGKYPWVKSLTVGLAVIAGLFLMFEVWFKVPLPKGPLEAAFGFS